MKPYILLTRPKGVADTWIEALKKADIPTLEAPLLHIHPQEVDWPDLSDYEGVIATSARAVEALSEHDTSPRLFCVGQATADRAKELGFKDVHVSGGTAEALIEDLTAYTGKKFLYLSGTVTSMDLPGTLDVKGVFVETLVVYDAAPNTSLPETVMKSLKNHEVTLVPFWSLAAAQAFLDLKKDGISFGQMIAVCKSKRIESIVAAGGWKKVITDTTMNPQKAIQLYLNEQPKEKSYNWNIIFGCFAGLVALGMTSIFLIKKQTPVPEPVSAAAPLPPTPAPPMPEPSVVVPIAPQPNPLEQKVAHLEAMLTTQAQAIAQTRQQQQALSENLQKIEVLLQELSQKQQAPQPIVAAPEPKSDKLLIATNLLYLEQSSQPEVVWKLIREPLLKNPASQELVPEFDRILAEKVLSHKDLAHELQKLKPSEEVKPEQEKSDNTWVARGKAIINRHIQVRHKSATAPLVTTNESESLLAQGNLKGAIEALPEELRKTPGGISWLAHAQNRLRFEEVLSGLTDIVLTFSDSTPEVQP